MAIPIWVNKATLETFLALKPGVQTGHVQNRQHLFLGPLCTPCNHA